MEASTKPIDHAPGPRCEPTGTSGRGADASGSGPSLFRGTWPILLSLVLGPAASATPQDRQVLIEWRFGGQSGWNGWTASPDLRDAAFAESGVTFTAAGGDPQILSPPFNMEPTSNRQWVEVEMECSGAGSGELFYTHTTEGPYGGLDARRCARFVVTPGCQRVAIWPFWEQLGRIIRLRLDPPSGQKCRLTAIRILQAAGPAGEPAWDFSGGPGTWQVAFGAEFRSHPGTLEVLARHPQAVILTPAEPFDAAGRSILRLDAACAGSKSVILYWASRDAQGMFGRPVELPGSDGPVEIDLRRFPVWKGTITHLGLGFGITGGERLLLRSLRIDPNRPDVPFPADRYIGWRRAVNRPGRPAELLAVFEHAGGPAPAALTVRCLADQADVISAPVSTGPAPGPSGRMEAVFRLVPRAAGPLSVAIEVGDRRFTRILRVDEPIRDPRRLERPADGYDVPEPQPVRTACNIGVYYFPGWAGGAEDRWRLQKDYPEREPALGWYREGMPEVADWHIKWALENGISFFVYDWYWRDGREELGEALNQGFLKARYADRMKFALMWANHPPFTVRGVQDLLAVVDYWVDRYLRRANYLTVDGLPYVSFFDPHQLPRDLGSCEQTAAALEAMRARVRAAGLPGLHIGACGGVNAEAAAEFRRCGFDSVTAYNYPGFETPQPQAAHAAFMAVHERLWKTMLANGHLPYFPLLTVGWDPRPWHGETALLYFGRSTGTLADGFRRLKATLDAHGRPMAILEAWNEWGEGSYLEPHAEFGMADLEALREVFAEPGEWPQNITPDGLGLTGRYDCRPAATAQGTPGGSKNASER